MTCANPRWGAGLKGEPCAPIMGEKAGGGRPAHAKEGSTGYPLTPGQEPDGFAMVVAGSAQGKGGS